MDPDGIFLLGLSLGGFFAPIIAQDAKIAGISVYGTIAFTPTPYPGRSERFFREIAEVDDILELWAEVDARVQVLHGTYDATTTASDHVKIAGTSVNTAQPRPCRASRASRGSIMAPRANRRSKPARAIPAAVSKSPTCRTPCSSFCAPDDR